MLWIERLIEVYGDGELLMRAVAAGDGWPLWGEEGYLVVHLANGDEVFWVKGDHTDWASSPMQRLGNLWWTVVPRQHPGELRYKISNNGGYDWADPYARAYRFEDGQEVSLIQPSAGHLERWLEVGDEQIAPRTLRVWVPERHATHFLYVHDGQNLFHPEAIWGGWNLHHHVGPSTLVVGIDNSPDRMNEYTHVEDEVFGGKVGGKGADYARYVENTVRPFIELRYGTPRVVGVMGSSLGGLMAFYQVHLFPDSYDFAASLSGTFGWGSFGQHTQTMIDIYRSMSKVRTRLYLDSGGGTDDPCADLDGDGLKDDSPGGRDNYCANRQFADELAAAGYEWDRDLWHWYEPDAPHAEWAWSDRVWRPLEIFEDIVPQA